MQMVSAPRLHVEIRVLLPFTGTSVRRRGGSDVDARKSSLTDAE